MNYLLISSIVYILVIFIVRKLIEAEIYNVTMFKLKSFDIGDVLDNGALISEKTSSVEVIAKMVLLYKTMRAANTTLFVVCLLSGLLWILIHNYAMMFVCASFATLYFVTDTLLQVSKISLYTLIDKVTSIKVLSERHITSSNFTYFIAKYPKVSLLMELTYLASILYTMYSLTFFK